jgi:hypothetical protein
MQHEMEDEMPNKKADNLREKDGFRDNDDLLKSLASLIGDDVFVFNQCFDQSKVMTYVREGRKDAQLDKFIMKKIQAK